MFYWITLLLFTVFVTAKPQLSGECGLQCFGSAYQCVEGECHCADGYIPDRRHTRCVRCPDLGDDCSATGVCCNSFSNATLQCWHGICQQCLDSDSKWICRDVVDQIILISTTQVIMGTTLVLGIIVTFMLLLKLCTVTDLSPLGNTSNYDSRLSVGSLQMYVDERLRDAPPRYSTAPTNQVTTVNAAACSSNILTHDRFQPPPPYAEVDKNYRNEPQDTTMHI